jgi:glycosyltransferase involved in cell wall biosynthesis
VDKAPTIAVVVTTYNHARFLDEALRSVCAQTHPATIVVVVDDGSTDDPSSVTKRFPNVRLIRQENRGLAAARNAGLAAVETSYVVFLDADDWLEPDAIESGLACFDRAPDSGFVYGGHRNVDADGQRIGELFEPPREHPYLQLLRGNFIGMHGTVMYRRDRLLAIGGFDEALRRCEDYDVYLRMARQYVLTGHANVIASYRLHGANMSANHRAMLRTTLRVHARHAPRAEDGATARAAWVEGRRGWRRHYAHAMAAARYRRRQNGDSLLASLPALVEIAAAAPGVALVEAASGLRHRIAAALQGRWGGEFVRETARPGRIRFGDLRRTLPVAGGSDRGWPIDRYYTDRFLARHSSEIRGRVLEGGLEGYAARFGDSRVSRRDALVADRDGLHAPFASGSAESDALPEQAFDCVLLTHSLQRVYDLPRAVASVHRALVPGGVVLVAAPGISRLDSCESAPRFWSFTPAGLHRLFADVFGADAVTVEPYGNLFAAAAFLHGIAVEEVTTADIDPADATCPVIVGIRARKRLR